MPIYEFAEYTLDTEEKRILHCGEVLTIPPKAFDILALLVENNGHLYTKQELLQAVWPDSFVADSSLAQHIYLLRKALGEISATPTFIETVPRRGYRFIAEVRVVDQVRAIETMLPATESLNSAQAFAVTQQDPTLRDSFTFNRRLVFASCLLLVGVLAGSLFVWRSYRLNSFSNQATNQQPKPFRGLPTSNPEAYEHYTRGVFFWNERNEESTRRAIESFQRAIQADPDFAMAYSMLGDSYGLVAYYRYGSIMPQREAYLNAEAAITTALSLDSEIAETHVAFAFIKLYYRHDVQGAEKELKRAIALNPNNGFAHQRYSTLLLVQGKLDEALAEVQIAHQLEPVSTRVSVSLATLLYYRRQFEEAKAVCREALDSAPNNPVMNHMLGVIHLSEGRPSEALAFFQKAHEIGGPDSDYLEGAGYVFAQTGKLDETRKMISEMELASSQEGHYYRNPSTLVILYAATGEVEKALKFIENKKDWDVMRMRPLLEFDPMLDRLRKDERFKELVARRFSVSAAARNSAYRA